jgi:excisionase family DNA binding protein
MPEQGPSIADFSTEQAAALMGVHSRSVLRWAKAGRLEAYQTGGGRWRIRQRDLVLFMTDRGMPIPSFLTSGAARIVIIDDDRNYLAALLSTLQELAPGADIRTAEDGLAAGLLLASFRPHLVLLDLVMPGLDGFQVYDRIRAHRELDATAVVVISGALNPDTRRRLVERGVAQCMAKPVSEARLQQVLVDLLPGAATSRIQAELTRLVPPPRDRA